MLGCSGCGGRVSAGDNQTNLEPPHPIAVLPFNDFSPAHNQGYLADGVAEQIINSLAQIKGLLVVARTSSFALKGKDEDIRTVGRRLHVRTRSKEA